MCDVDVMLYMYFHVSVIILLVLDWMQNKFWIFESLQHTQMYTFFGNPIISFFSIETWIVHLSKYNKK